MDALPDAYREVFLLRAVEPVSWREIQEQFAEDYGGTGEAAIRKFERDKADLLELAIPIRYEPGDEDQYQSRSGPNSALHAALSAHELQP